MSFVSLQCIILARAVFLSSRIAKTKGSKNQQHEDSLSFFPKSESFIVIDYLILVFSIVEQAAFLRATMAWIKVQNGSLADLISNELVSIQAIPNSWALELAYYSLTSLSLRLSFLLPTRMRLAQSSPFSFSQSTQYWTLMNEFLLVRSKISSTPSTLRQQMGVMVLYLSVPAVSHNCTFIILPSLSSMIFCLYYTPIVGVTLSVDSPTYLLNRLVFPTALSPSRSILQRSPSLIKLLQYQVRQQIRIQNQSQQMSYWCDDKNMQILDQFSLRVRPSVSLSKLALFLRMMVILGLISLLPSRSTFSSWIDVMVAQPFLERICENLNAREMDSPMASSWTVPCFLRTSLERKTPSLSLEFLRTLQTLFQLNL